MIGRRQFLAGSSAAGGMAAAAPALARGPSGGRVTISETFAPAEWRDAFQTAMAVSGDRGDRAFWRDFDMEAPIVGEGEFHLVSLPAPGLEPFAPELAGRLAVVANDRLADTVRAAGGRLGGLAAISAFDPQAVREAERAVTRLGLSGIALGANRGMRLSHRELWLLYDFAQSARVPIYLPSAYGPAAADAPYRALGRQGVIEGASADSASHASQLIFGGVLDAFPQATFILGRLGEATPHWISELALAHAGLSADQAPQFRVEDYFRRNLYLTTADIVSADTLEFCSNVLGPGRMLRARGAGALRNSTADESLVTSVAYAKLGRAAA